MSKPKRFLIMAGGTGGHVFPALAVAQELRARDALVYWLGSFNSMEASLIAKTDIPFYGLSVKGLRGNGLVGWLKAPFMLLHAVLQSLRYIRQLQPDAVLGMGGFASGPGGLAAKLARRPLVVHEQNAIAGMTNQYLSRVADIVLEAFPCSFGKSDARIRTIGNPLRADIIELGARAEAQRGERLEASDDAIKLLVLGGSLGAAAINQCVPGALKSLNLGNAIRVWHQCGKDKAGDTEKAYHGYHAECRIDTFIDDMAEAYDWADFVICRSGALTVSELCVAGLGAVLVPYPHAVDDHQSLNAKAMSDHGAAIVMPQQQLNPATLAESLQELIVNKSRIRSMGEAAREQAKPDATHAAVEACWEVCDA